MRPALTLTVALAAVVSVGFLLLRPAPAPAPTVAGVPRPDHREAPTVSDATQLAALARVVPDARLVRCRSALPTGVLRAEPSDAAPFVFVDDGMLVAAVDSETGTATLHDGDQPLLQMRWSGASPVGTCETGDLRTEVLDGRVRLPDGEPAAGVQVLGCTPGVLARTDDDGAYSLTRVPGSPCHPRAFAFREGGLLLGEAVDGELRLPDEPRPLAEVADALRTAVSEARAALPEASPAPEDDGSEASQLARHWHKAQVRDLDAREETLGRLLQLGDTEAELRQLLLYAP
jgi:hypothetical protein